MALSKGLRAHPECPGWIRRYSPHAYAAGLTRWAQAGWTDRDVIQHLNDVATTAFEAAKTSGWTAAELSSTGLHAPAAPRGRRATRNSVPMNTQESAEPTTAGDSPAAPAGDDAADSAA